MNETQPIEVIDGLKRRDALCVADTEELAMEIAAWLYDHCGGRRAYYRRPLLRIIDATDHPTVRGYLIFWPTVSERGSWGTRAPQRQAIANQFAGRGIR